MQSTGLILGGLVGFLFYAVFLVGAVAVGGFVIGWTFRKGWDRAGRRG